MLGAEALTCKLRMVIGTATARFPRLGKTAHSRSWCWIIRMARVLSRSPPPETAARATGTFSGVSQLPL